MPQLENSDSEQIDSDIDSPLTLSHLSTPELSSCSDNEEIAIIEPGYVTPVRCSDANECTSDDTQVLCHGNSGSGKTFVSNGIKMIFDLFLVNETEHWLESDNEIEGDIHQFLSLPPLLPDVPPPAQVTENKKVEAVIWWIVTFISLFETLHFIPERAVLWLMKFIRVMLKYCGQFSPHIAEVAEKLPQSSYMRDKYLEGSKITTMQYVVCSKCHSMYSFEQCIQKHGSQLSSKSCSYKHFSKLCNAVLLKQVVTSSGSSKFYPVKMYSYCSVICTLRKFLLRPHFHQLCEKTRCVDNGMVLADIQDGRIWKEFLHYGTDSRDFLQSPNNYAFMLNVDWFQPYEHFTYSVGVLYLVVLNLPRDVRYKRENVILVGIIPGPSEPHYTINSYLDPLVTDLLSLWNGVEMQTSESTFVVRAALLAIACDLPAGRKVCGFLSHSANLGCSRCYSSFSRLQNYSDFNRNEWELRSNEKHRKDVDKLNKCKTKTERERMESKFGCRYSELLRLPYFDPVRMLVLDPMHNLFLGTAKHITQKLYIGSGIINRSKLDIIHKRIQSVKVPVNIGRIPSAIETGATFTAEQWMNWTLYFSVYCLHGLLSNEDMECWRHFVLACRKLSRQSISYDDITVADELLLQFGKRIKQLHGEGFITPNMHMQCHLAECIKDYGPLHAFWLFAFERYNGLLGNQPTNNRAIELQLMNRFLKDTNHLELLHSADCKPFFDIFGAAVSDHAKSFTSNIHVSRATESASVVTEPRKYKLSILCPDEIDVLKKVYCKLHPQYQTAIIENKLTILSSVKRYSHIQLRNVKLSSVIENAKVPYVMAKPFFLSSSMDRIHVQLAQIQYFIKHSLIIPPSLSSSSSEEQQSYIFAVVKWPQIHPQRHSMGKPVELWCTDLFQHDMNNHFLPIENIESLLMTAVDYVGTLNEKLLVVIPLIQK